MFSCYLYKVEVAKHAAVLRKSGIKASDKGPTKYFGIPQTPREYRESIPPAVLERVRRDYPSRRDARIAEDDLPRGLLRGQTGLLHQPARARGLGRHRPRRCR